uniref:Vitellogenin domain-containing protein n=1 Tax=Strigamia maritima TaxID=126957 RepID=T1J1M1_STRMM
MVKENSIVDSLIHIKREKEAINLSALKDSLQRSSQVAQGMTTILTSFENRLAKLEQTILPVYTETETLQRRQNNIEKTLAALDHVISYYNVANDVEHVIKDGPTSGLEVYLESINKIRTSIQYFELNNANSPELHNLNCQPTICNKFACVVESLRAMSLKALEDFIESIKSDLDRQMPKDGTVHQLTSNAMMFLEQLMDYAETVGELLLKTDKMAASPTTEKKKNAMGHYILRVLTTLNLTLCNKSESYSDPCLKSIFRLNNLNYISKSLQRSGLLEIVQMYNKDIEEHFNDQIREHKRLYSHSWSRVLHYVMEVDKPLSPFSTTGKLKDKDRQNIKDKFTKGYALPDVELREGIKRENKEFILPKYQAFYDKYTEIQFSKNPDKYVKYTPIELSSSRSAMAKLISIAAVLGFLAAVQCKTLPKALAKRDRCDQKGFYSFKSLFFAVSHVFVRVDEYWESGSTYKYKYEAVVYGLANSGSDVGTGTKISCQVALTSTGQCLYGLQVRDCELSVAGSDVDMKFSKHEKSSEFSEEMARYDLAFTMSHGQVLSLNVNELEPVSITNIKRGIITNLQGCKRENEADYDDVITDVQGTCPVHFEKSNNVITQTKDVNHCSFPSRPDWEYSPNSLIWNMSFMQYGLNAMSKCEHEIAAKALQKSTCTERHSLRYDPRLNKAHAQTLVKSTLELTGSEKQSGLVAKGNRITGIQYEWETHSTPSNEESTFLTSANAIVDHLVATTLEGVQPDSDAKFDELVHLFRKNRNVLEFTKKVAANSRSTPIENEIALSFVRDALVTCNREPCIHAITYLATNNHLSDNYITVLLYTLTKTNVKTSGYLTAVVQICKVKPSRTCLLSLTSMIHTYIKNNPEEAKTNTPQAIKDTAKHLLKMLTDPKGPAPQDKAEKIILALKAVGNLGDIAIDAEPTILDKVRSYVNDAEKPHNVSLQAIRALRRVSSHNQEVYGTLIGIVRDPNQHMEHKVVAYLVLTYNYHPKLYKDLAIIIPTEPTDQLGNFVTMHMNNVLLYGDDSLASLKESIVVAFETHPYTFVLNGERPYTTSRHRENVRLRKSPFLPDFASRFGYDIQSSAIYEAFSFLPQHLIVNLTTQLFGKKFNSLTLGAALHGLDPYLEFFFNFKTGGKVETLLDRFKALQEHTDLSGLLRSSNWVPHFDSDIEQKLTQIHDSVIHDYGKEQFAATFSLSRFGDELAYTSWGIIKAKIYSFVENDFQNIDWEANKEYRAHRFIRFLEGSNRIPLLVGLPLKWKTTADLIFSLRLDGNANPFGLLSEPQMFTAKWAIHPSGLFTMVNKMIVKVPEFTKNGIQVITTLHRSRDSDGSVTSFMGNLELKVEVSPKRQNLINFNRKVYFIRDGQLEAIGDGDLKRVEKEDCHSCDVTGLKFCRRKSYADVSNRRIHDVLTNNLEYHVYYELADKDLKAYELNVEKQVHDSGETEYKFKFQAPGEKWKREVSGRYVRNLETKEFSLRVEVPEKPHFKLHASRKQNKEGDVVTGYKTNIDAEIIKGRPIVLNAESFNKPTGHKEVQFVLSLKDRSYNYRRIYLKTANKIEIDNYITYDSSNPKSFLHQILPDIAFKSAKTATAHLHIDITKNPGADEWERAINAHIKLPKAIFELNTNRFSNKEKGALHFKVTRRQLPSNDMESFLHLTYDRTTMKKGDQNIREHQLRFAIPRVRWTAEFNRKYDVIDNKNFVILKREKATDSTLEVTDSTPVDKQELSLSIKHRNESAARGEMYPTPRERNINAVLTYPRDGTHHTVTYNVNIINDEGQRNAETSFKTDGTLACSRRQLKFHGVSDYIRTRHSLNANYNLDIDNLATGNKANYKADLKVKYDFSSPLVFTQSYESSRYNFKEVATVKRTEDGGTSIDLEMNAVCPTWDFLTFDLKQQLYLHYKEASWEKMEFRHKYVDIDVKGEYKLPFGKYSKKEFQFKSKNSIFPSTNIHTLTKDYHHHSVHVEYPDEKRNVYIVAETDDKEIDIVVDSEKEGSPRKQVITWSLRILKDDMIERNYTVDTKAVKKAVHRHVERIKKLIQAWNEIKDDPNHPMNKYLQPIVKTTVGDYIRECKRKRLESQAAIREAFEDALESLAPIYVPGLQVAGKVIEYLVVNYLEPLRAAIEKYLKREDVQQRIREHIDQAIERLKMRIQGESVTMSGSGSTTFKVPFHVERFSKPPLLTPEMVRFVHLVRSTYHINEFPSTRYAVMYGNHNVYTFDGKTYKVENIPNDKCTFLLAHNFVARRFSLLAQEGILHLLLPNVAVTLNKQGHVLINKQKTDLPIDKDGVKISEEGGILKVESNVGIDLELDLKNEVVLVGMSFWNHNKTLGLLGNNDNERKNDYRLTDGHLASDEPELLSRYELSGNSECSDRNLLGKRQENCDSIVPDECNTYLNKYKILSPYFMCFDVVDPFPFERSCERDARCGGNVCSSIRAYLALCEKHNIRLSMPETCQ